MFLPIAIVLLYISHSMSIKVDNYDNYRGNVFGTFVKNYLDLLIDGCSGKLLKDHLKIMHKELDKIGYKYTKKLAKIYRSLSKSYTDLIHGELKEYRKEVDRTTRRRTEFLAAMNEAFHARESRLFENYLYDLSDYCGKKKYSIEEESHKLLHDAILNPVDKLSYKKQKDLRKKLDSALKEYTRMYDEEQMKLFNMPPLRPSHSSEQSSWSD